MLVDDLKTLLASSYAYSLKAANYHWNIEGDKFIAFHPWLGELYNNVYGTVDQLAEYIRVLQAYTPASLIRFQELTKIKDQVEVAQYPEIFEFLLDDTGVLINLLNTAFDSATAERQQGIADYMAGRVDAMQKYAWQIRSTLKTIPGGDD